jgi:glycosyltransferase involved in cell wall biosynthesis
MAITAPAEKIAVILPCFNEEAAIGRVIDDFKAALPDAKIHVFDNASSDNTAAVALAHGAQVHRVAKRGKGYVVQAMFRDVFADYYVIADGDGTYPAAEAPAMVAQMLAQNADVVVGSRMALYRDSQSRSGHFWGNQLLTKTVNYLFDSEVEDLLSGYRVMSRRFIKSMPLFSKGFEVETAMTIHAVEVGAKTVTLPVAYLARVEGTESKLNTVRDGARIFLTIFRIYKDHKPFVVYGLLGLLMALLSIAVGTPVVLEFIKTGLVPRFPSAILASALMILGFLSGFTGIILSAIAKSRRDIKKIAFLSMP